MRLLIIFSFLFVLISKSYTNKFQCDRRRFPLVTDLRPSDCDTANGYHYIEDAVHGCFPACLHIETQNVWPNRMCHGEAANGRCFCFDALGNRIFGHAFSVDADDMTCACSRQRSDMERTENHVFVSLHCARNGNYEPLQCDIGSQQCWCAEPRTGAPISPIVPLGTMSRLPCYDRRTIGAQYLRRCESELYAQRRIAEEFRMHGTTTVNFPLHFCQYDGSFGPIRVERGIVFCVWRDGSHLGYQQAADSSLVNVTCNCAIDERIFAEAGLNHMMSCLGNGNYNPVQFSGTHYFCVDHNGFMVGELTEDRPDCPTVLNKIM